MTTRKARPSRLRLWKAAFILMLASRSISSALAACHAVTPSGAGAKTGADWNNAYAGLPATLVRGDIYYLGDGSYGHSLTLDTAASGTATIELRKAQSYDNGSGCSTSIAAGWNTATMGSAQAAWSWAAAGAIVNFSSGYWIINGNGNNAGTSEVGCGGVNVSPPSTMTGPAPKPAACGIKIDDSTCNLTTTDGCDPAGGVIRGGGDGIVFESVELLGQGLNSAGNNDSEPYYWFASGGALSGVNISHSYLHNAGTTYLTVVTGGWSGSFDHNYVWGLFDGSVNHGEAIQLQGSNSNMVVAHNVFRDQQTNGDVVAVITGTQSNLSFYDNTDFCSAGGTATSCRHNDGGLGAFSGQTASNWLVYNNTFSFPGNCGWNVSGGPSTMTVENNLYYNCASIGRVGGTNVVDYNSYLNSNSAAVGTHDVSMASGAPDPFASPTSVQLTTENALWDNRKSLGAPYDTLDLYGNPFTTDRGASQEGAPLPALPAAPTQLKATVH